MSRMSGYRSLGHSLGHGFHPEGSRFQLDHAFFPKTTKKPLSPKNMSRARRPPLGDHLIPILGVIMCCIAYYPRGGRRAPLGNPTKQIMCGDQEVIL